MVHYYLQIKAAHIFLGVMVGAFFLASFVAASRPSLANVRALMKYLSWTVDLTLLTAALMLLTILPAAMYSNGWLIVKMVALAFFVACRQFMISDQPPGLPRWGWFLLGAIVLGYAYSVARAHHPLGFFSDLK
ncbi:SirB2 family protein [Pseudoxanthomonas mexicana]|jgi:uncharacterized membrane protein SirB2|uniref:SirB2 family protein n=1 Tax=Pseudoxanthomonas mexicana TaxID=128785 RepID=UPI000784806B|nr:SirB2 family protein [Pseudoxanthomonas mexicana]